MGITAIDVSFADRPPSSVDDPSFSAGDTIRVIVTVEVDAPTRCRELVLRVRLVGEGAGFELARELQREVLATGDLAQGTHRFERELAVPSGPPSYDGVRIGWAWRVEARADLPQASDVSGHQRFVLVAPPMWQGVELDLPPPDGPEALTRSDAEAALLDRSAWRLGGFGALVAAGGLAGIAHHLAIGSTQNALNMAIAMAVLGGAGVLLVVGAPLLGRLLGSSPTSPLDVAVSLKREGDESALGCELRTRPDARVDTMRARIEIAEWLVWQATTSTTPRLRREKVTRWARTVVAEPTGEPGVWQCRLPLPEETVPGTVVDAGGHGLVWQVEVLVEHSGGKRPDQPIIRRFVARPV